MALERFYVKNNYGQFFRVEENVSKIVTLETPVAFHKDLIKKKNK